MIEIALHYHTLYSDKIKAALNAAFIFSLNLIVVIQHVRHVG